MGVNLTDWLGDNSWALWLSLAFLLAVAEILSLDLVLIMLAVGALAGAGVAVLAPDLWWLQILVAAGVSVGHAAAAAADPDGPGAQHAGLPVLDRQDGRQQRGGGLPDRPQRRRDQGGRAELDGAAVRSDLVIEQGTEIEVYEIDGAIAVVYPKHDALP